MKNVRFSCASVLALVVCAGCLEPGSEYDNAFRAKNTLYVTPVDSVTFEVTQRPGNAPEDIWCAASDYARRALGQPWGARIYVARGRAPGPINGAEAVKFTMDPVAEGITPSNPFFVLKKFEVGYNRSVTSADSDCRHFDARFTR